MQADKVWRQEKDEQIPTDSSKVTQAARSVVKKKTRKFPKRAANKRRDTKGGSRRFNFAHLP